MSAPAEVVAEVRPTISTPGDGQGWPGPAGVQRAGAEGWRRGWRAGGLAAAGGDRLAGAGGAGGLAGWRAGGLAGWRAGGLAGWRAGGLAGWRAGGLAGWRENLVALLDSRSRFMRIPVRFRAEKTKWLREIGHDRRHPLAPPPPHPHHPLAPSLPAPSHPLAPSHPRHPRHPIQPPARTPTTRPCQPVRPSVMLAKWRCPSAWWTPLPSKQLAVAIPQRRVRFPSASAIR